MSERGREMTMGDRPREWALVEALEEPVRPADGDGCPGRGPFLAVIITRMFPTRPNAR